MSEIEQRLKNIVLGLYIKLHLQINAHVANEKNLYEVAHEILERSMPIRDIHIYEYVLCMKGTSTYSMKLLLNKLKVPLLERYNFGQLMLLRFLIESILAKFQKNELKPTMKIDDKLNYIEYFRLREYFIEDEEDEDYSEIEELLSNKELEILDTQNSEEYEEEYKEEEQKRMDIMVYTNEVLEQKLNYTNPLRRTAYRNQSTPQFKWLLASINNFVKKTLLPKVSAEGNCEVENESKGSLEEERNTFQRTISNMEGTILDLKSPTRNEVNDLKIEIEELRANMSRFRAERNYFQEQRDSLQAERNSFQTTISNMGGTILDLEIGLLKSPTRNEVSDLEIEIEELRANMSRSRINNYSLQAEIEELRANMSRSRINNYSLQAERDSLQEQRDSLQEQRDSLRVKMNSLQVENNSKLSNGRRLMHRYFLWVKSTIAKKYGRFVLAGLFFFSFLIFDFFFQIIG